MIERITICETGDRKRRVRTAQQASTPLFTRFFFALFLRTLCSHRPRPRALCPPPQEAPVHAHNPPPLHPPNPYLLHLLLPNPARRYPASLLPRPRPLHLPRRYRHLPLLHPLPAHSHNPQRERVRRGRHRRTMRWRRGHDQ